jgi:hypothetical protein
MQGKQLFAQFERAKDNQFYNYIYLNSTEIEEVFNYHVQKYKIEKKRVIVKVYNLDDSTWYNLDPVTGITTEGTGGGPTPILTDHNNLTGIQGGNFTERYHFNLAQHTKLLAGNYQGDWNAFSNSPAIEPASSLNKDQFYRVNVAGSTLVNGISTWKIGDLIYSTGMSWIKIAGSSDPENYEVLTVVTNGQTSFALGNSPINPMKIKLEVNGAKQTFGVDFNVTGTVLNWFGNFELHTNDKLEIYYI